MASHRLDVRSLNYYTIRMVEKSSRRPSRKQALFDAAVRVVVDEGVNALTIDAVARLAGVTKGGVQYHFASKDRLVEALLTDVLADMDRAIEDVVAAEPGPGAWHRAYVGLILWELSDLDRCVAALLLSMPPGDPLGKPYEAMAERWRSRAAADGLDPATSLIVRHAADGIWLERSYGGATDKEIALVRSRLMQMIDAETLTEHAP
jgi:AcrR family transcriptional regulator